MAECLKRDLEHAYRHGVSMANRLDAEALVDSVDEVGPSEPRVIAGC